MIDALFPPGVTVVTATEAMLAHPLHPLEAARTERMAPKRLREFTLGRACVRAGLSRLGIEDFPFLNAEDRAPIWPEGIVGTLTHCRDLCAAALCRQGKVLGLGLDAESLNPLEPAIVERITRPAEREHFATLPAADHPGGWPLLAFSAKEAFYKAYYPLAATYLGFRDAELTFDAQACTFHVLLTREDAPDAAGRRGFEGRFAVGEACVATAVSVLRREEVPSSTGPSPLPRRAG